METPSNEGEISPSAKNLDRLFSPSPSSPQEDLLLAKYILQIQEEERAKYESKLEKIEAKYELRSQNLEAERNAERNRMIKLENKLEERDNERILNEKHHQEEKDRILKDKEQERIKMEEKFKIEIAEERNRLIKEKDEERKRLLQEKEEERNRILKEKVDERKEFLIERKEIIKEKEELLTVILSPKSRSILMKEKKEDEAKEEDPSFTNNTNIITAHGEDEITNELEDEEKIENQLVLDWMTLTLSAIIMKIQCFLVCLAISILVYVVYSLCSEKDFGIVHIISIASNTNYFFIAFVLARFFMYNASFFMYAGKITEAVWLFYFSSTSLSWLLMSVLTRVIFPSLLAKRFSSSIEIGPSTHDKILMIVIMIVSNYISEVISFTLVLWFDLSYRQDWLPVSLQRINGEKDYKACLYHSLKFSLTLTLFLWFLLLMIIGIGSISNIPTLDPNLEIMLFGYFFPLFKAAVISICYHAIRSMAGDNWSPEYIARMVSSCSGTAIVICSIAQMYVIFRTASDYSFFLNQYLPHEIIKKLSWLTFHPLYLKTKIQVLDILSVTCVKICKKKDKVNPKDAKNQVKRRYTLALNDTLSSIAGDIVGRQFGEDLTMILIAIWMLPICQAYLSLPVYPQVSNIDNSLPFPSYENIFIIICCTAYGVESVLTIICFALLERVGIPLSSNKHVLHYNFMSFAMCTFACTAYLLVLSATFNY